MCRLYTEYIEYADDTMFTEYGCLIFSPASPLLRLFCNWELEPLVSYDGTVDDKHRPVLLNKKNRVIKFLSLQI